MATVSATILLFVSGKSPREAEQVSALAMGVSWAGFWPRGWLAWLGFAWAIAVLEVTDPPWFLHSPYLFLPKTLNFE